MNTLCKNAKKRVWSDEEISFLCENWGQKSVGQIAGKLKRSKIAVMSKADRLKLGGIFRCW